MTSLDSKRRIITYLVIVFLFSSIFYVLIFRQPGGIESPAGQGFTLGLMWSPAAAALITTFIFQRNLRGLGWALGKPKFYLIAYLTPIFYASMVYLSVWVLGLGDFNDSDNWISVVLRSLTSGVLMAAISAVGEEIGWRGLLVPQLARLESFTQTALISGVIWGIWHIPIIIGGGYNSGAPTWYSISCFMVEIIGISFAFAWVRLASGSIWPALILHATHNSFIQSALDELTINTGSTHYFTTEFGIGLAIMGVIVGLFFWRLGRNLDLTKKMEMEKT
jgi:membrane protease YdiL (CAAX protease family)